MINTIETKEQQLQNGYYQIGAGSETILILGSCRAVPYITYFNDINKSNKYSICFIDPMNWNWDMKGDRVDYEAKLNEAEKNNNILELLKKVDIFIHEHYINAGMFNVSKFATKNIYEFGMNPTIDIELPNFNDIFILTNEIVSFDMAIRKMAIQDYNVNGALSMFTLNKIDEVRQKNLQKFYDICSKTSFPEFAEIFANEYKLVRYFWTFNHVSSRYTTTLFKMMCTKYLKIDIENVTTKDLFANNYTHLCEYDLVYEWNEEIKPLKL
jgi:hypothetical protein